MRVPVFENDMYVVPAGHFDTSKVRGSWTDREPGTSSGSGGTGRGTALLLTAGGRWVLEHWTCWQDETSRYEYYSGRQAQDWLLANREDGALAEHFPDMPEEEDRRPGGSPVLIQLDADVLADLDEYAAEQGWARHGTVNWLLREALDAARPYTVTAEDLSTRNREIIPPRYRTLGAAVEALRKEQACDREDNGLPSRSPRVEHDGRPVDVEHTDSAAVRRQPGAG
jgi:hypothetical protein